MFLERGDVSDLARSVFGASRRVAGVERLRGGSKKGVYRLLFDDGFAAILYLWSDDENYWPAAVDDEGPFSHASGLRLFSAAHGLLEEVGVRVPRLYVADDSQSRFPADLALVEDVRGGTLERRLDDDPQGGTAILGKLARSLERMRQRTSPRIGKIAEVADGSVAQPDSCVAAVLDRALRDLDEAAARVGRIAEARAECVAVLEELAAAIEPRSRHGLIHGELGPDHVLIDDQDEPVLVDIEGTMFFDVEWEHVFLRIRFHEHYAHLRVDGLDERRMELYRLAQHLSLVAGPLRLLEGDFPDRDFMEGLVRHHTAATLALVPAERPRP
ncbi:phosphotransferase [Nonomuraea sp. NPDC004354]